MKAGVGHITPKVANIETVISLLCHRDRHRAKGGHKVKYMTMYKSDPSLQHFTIFFTTRIIKTHAPCRFTPLTLSSQTFYRSEVHVCQACMHGHVTTPPLEMSSVRH